MAALRFTYGAQLGIVASSIAIMVVVAAAIICLLIPEVRAGYMSRKREMLSSLTQLAVDAVEPIYQRSATGEITEKVAQEMACHMINGIRYGKRDDGYFYITDTNAIIVMHPYLPSLEGSPVAETLDRYGKEYSKDFIAAAAHANGGFVEYLWGRNSTDDQPSRKLAHCRPLEHWNWIIGTGVYLDDIDAEISELMERIFFVAGIILSCLLVAISYIIWQGSALARKKAIAMAQLERSARELKLMLSNMINAFVVWDMVLENGRVKSMRFGYFNEAYSKVSKLKLQDAFGKDVYEVWPDTEQSWIDIYGKIALTGEPLTFEMYHVSTKGTYHCNAYRPGESPTQVCCIFEDITQRKLDEAALKELNENLERNVQTRTTELESVNNTLRESLENLRQTQDSLIESEKMAALGGLVAGVAHEVNTPLGIGITAASHLEDNLKRCANLYKEDNLGREEFEKFLDLCSETCRILLTNLRRAAEQVRSFKRIAVDQSTEEMRSFDLREYLGEIVLSLHPKHRNSKYKIESNCPSGLTIRSYPGVLAQIFTNLVMNSLSHGFEGRDAGIINITVEPEADALHIEYTDDGVGVPPENRKKMFTPFFTTKRGQGGSGLGMHITYNLVMHKLGGQIRFDLACEHGVRYEICLPMRQEKGEILIGGQ